MGERAVVTGGSFRPRRPKRTVREGTLWSARDHSHIELPDIGAWVECGAMEHARVERLIAFSLTTHGAAALAAFYVDGLGFERVSDARLSGARFEQAMGVTGDALRITLRLGAQRVELLQLGDPGRPYPREISSSDPRFQHLALVASDIDEAYQRLQGVPGWTAISLSGPERLPAASGGVSAFKFRDPEGHPLELLGFPPDKAPAPWRATHRGGGGLLGIDHSAIVVGDLSRSEAFYASLGLVVGARTVNRGPEQARLDALPEPVVDVVALEPPRTPSHVELLGYRSPAKPEQRVSGNDIAATRLVFDSVALTENAGGRAETRALVDPDGHRLLLRPSGAADVLG